MLTVTWRLNPLIVTAHLVFGMTTLALLWWLTLSLPTSSWGTAAMGSAGQVHQRRRRLAAGERAPAGAPGAWPR